MKYDMDIYLAFSGYNLVTKPYFVDNIKVTLKFIISEIELICPYMSALTEDIFFFKKNPTNYIKDISNAFNDPSTQNL